MTREFLSSSSSLVLLLLKLLLRVEANHLEQFFTIPEGSAARLECYSSKPNVVWKKAYASRTQSETLSRNGVRAAPGYDRVLFERERIETDGVGMRGVNGAPPGNARYKYVMKLKSVGLEDSGLYTCDNVYSYFVSIVTEPSCQPIIALMNGPLVEGEVTRFECVAEVSSASRIDPRMRFGGDTLTDAISMGTKSSNVYLSWVIGDKTLKTSQADDMTEINGGVTSKKLSLSLAYVADGDDHAKALKCVLHSDAWKRNKAWESGEGVGVMAPTCRVGVLNVAFGPKLDCNKTQIFLDGSPAYNLACDVRANPLPPTESVKWRVLGVGLDHPFPGQITHKRDFRMKAVVDVKPLMQSLFRTSQSFSLTVNSSLRISTQKTIEARVKKSVGVVCSSRKRITTPLTYLVMCVVNAGTRLTRNHVRWKYEDRSDIPDSKVEYYSSPPASGAILNVSEAEGSVFFILMGVGPLRDLRQEFKIEVPAVRDGLFSSWASLAAETVYFVATNAWVLAIVGGAVAFVLLVCCFCASLFHAGLLEPKPEDDDEEDEVRVDVDQVDSKFYYYEA